MNCVDEKGKCIAGRRGERMKIIGTFKDETSDKNAKEKNERERQG